MPRTAFYAFPARPESVGQSVSQAIGLLEAARELILTPWPKLDVQGLKIDDLIRERIDTADIFLADITYPNFNVYYEIGYSIGRQKPIVPTVNYAITKAVENVNLTGIFDTIGQTRYQNAAELADGLSSNKADAWTNHYLRGKNHNQPLFFLDTLHKTDFRNYIIQSISNSSVQHRAFDPSEVPRLSLTSAIADISSSAGAIIPLISPEINDWQRHNLRAAFLAGMCHGFGIETLILQYEDSPAPLDFRDFIDTARTRHEIEQAVGEFCQATLIRNQQRADILGRGRRTLLDEIDIGSSAAENEYEKLGRYFVRTAEFARALRANASLIVGRKGSGKTAIFFELIASKSSDRRNLILDLRPASHNLSELREQLLSAVNVGVFDHTIAAFWQYILYAEIALKLREELLPKAKYSLNILKDIKTLEERFKLTEEMVAGDFTSRLELAIRSILSNLNETKSGKDVKEQLTNLLFEKDIPVLRDAIISLADNFKSITLLMDDLDKGWPARQIEAHDIRTVQHLIAVLQKMQRELEKREISFEYHLFLRSDVYENLVQETSDRGKYNLISVDWTDATQLERLIRDRVIASISEDKQDDAWLAVNPVLKDGKTAIGQMILSSLMRPRFLIDLCEKAISFAINRGHSAVEHGDVDDALRQHSLYLVSDFGYELRDVSGISEDIFYKFIGQSEILTPQEVEGIVAGVGGTANALTIVDLLVWYGFLGIPGSDGKPIFIYDRQYDMRRLDAERQKQAQDLLYVVNPAFLKGLNE